MIYHWETALKISGYFEKSENRWLICVNKCPVDPQLLAGRKITVRAEGENRPRRLGKYLHNISTVSYFLTWPGKENDDFWPPKFIQNEFRKLRIEIRPEKRNEIERDLRQQLKTQAARERIRLGATDWPIEVFERYTLEKLDDELLSQCGAGLCRLPINQFYNSQIDGLRLLNDFLIPKVLGIPAESL